MGQAPEPKSIHKVGPVGGYDQAIKEMVRLVRAVGDGKVEVETGRQMVGMLGRVVQAINLRRRTELDERRLDVLGAAAQEGAAVFEGFAIIPPRSRLPSGPDPAAPPLLEAKPNGELLSLRAPTRRKKNAK